MLRELGPSIRGLVRAPAHSAIVVLTMALGLGAAAALLLPVGLGASMLPARRAAGIDPVIALKM